VPKTYRDAQVQQWQLEISPEGNAQVTSMRTILPKGPRWMFYDSPQQTNVAPAYLSLDGLDYRHVHAPLIALITQEKSGRNAGHFRTHSFEAQRRANSSPPR
jgi:hypothetical protein